VDDLPVTLARGDGVLGEVALRRRTGRHAQPVYELIVNGVFLMDTAETSTENLLADAVLDRHASPRRVLVGGLGLGITVMALLADARVEQILVAEIEPLLVDWLRTGLVLPARPAVLDPRVQVAVGDVIDVLRSTPDHSYDAILLDVDNGPAFLVHPQNAAVYKRPVLEQVARVLAPDGCSRSGRPIRHRPSTQRWAPSSAGSRRSIERFDATAANTAITSISRGGSQPSLFACRQPRADDIRHD
jgi:hypothetical protein